MIPLLIDEYSRDFVESRLQSARNRASGPSTTVILIGRLAVGLRRLASAVEGWASGTSDNPPAKLPDFTTQVKGH